MERRRIGAAVVAGIDRLLAEGLDHATIATRLNVTPYVIGVIAGDKLRVGRRQPRDYFTRDVLNSAGVDAITIRMIRRMLEAGWLNQRQIAGEMGVSPQLVMRVAAGTRLPVSTERPFLFKDLGEQLLDAPIRCLDCGATISIAPCRACRALRS